MPLNDGFKWPKESQKVNDSSFDALLNQTWNGHLEGYLHHKNDEHVEALILEVQRFFERRLVVHLAPNSIWHISLCSRRVAAILFLVDRGIVQRILHSQPSVLYRPATSAEHWLLSQQELLPITDPVLELLSALRRDVALATNDSNLINEEPA